MDQFPPTPITDWREKSDFFKSRDEGGGLLLKACITREGSVSSRALASHIKSSFRETRSFRQLPTTISSTASSPGYTLRDQIDPSTYSFTAALKALQGRTSSGWDWGKTLNSKWDEAEKYICNPLSGEVPIECLSAKTLSGRSIPTSNRIAKSAPLLFSNPGFQTHPTHTPEEPPFSGKFDVEMMGSYRSWTRDVGTQSTPPDRSPASSTPSTTPSMQETSETCVVVGEVNGSQVDPKSREEEVRWKQGQERKKRSGFEQTSRFKFSGCLPCRLGFRKQRQKEEEEEDEEENI